MYCFPLGIDQAYEAPENPEIVLDAGNSTLDECVQQMIELLQERGVVPRSVGTAVRELFVPECRLPEAKQEAEGLKCVEISKLDLQWVQVSAPVYKLGI